MIPTFFAKILASQLPAERFGQMLGELVKSAYLTPHELKSLCVTGFGIMIDDVLKHRLLTSAEERRILELKSALSINTADIPDTEDKLTKVGILRDIAEGNRQERVQLVGPMPIKLLPGEDLLWVFNRTKCYRPPADETSVGLALDFLCRAPGSPQYCPANSLGTDFTPKRVDLEDGAGDLVITNVSIHFLSEGRLRKIPFAKIAELHSYADGIKVTRGISEKRIRTFFVDDPWFATNLIVSLAGLTASDPGQRDTNNKNNSESEPLEETARQQTTS